MIVKHFSLALSSLHYTAKKSNIASENQKKPDTDMLTADDNRYVRKDSSSGKYMFRLRAANNQVTGVSELYESEDARNNNIASVEQNALSVKVANQSS